MNWIKGFLVLALFCATERFCHLKTHGFRPYKITSKETIKKSDLPLEGVEKNTLKALLDQPYYFLNSGGESYVFLSEDKRTVIKFFKHHHLRERAFIDLLTNRWKKERARKREKLFTSCLIAQKWLPEETGLIALHLSKTPGYFNQKLTLVDAIGVSHKIDLDQTDFALQHRGTLAFDVLKREKDPKLLDAIIALIKARSCKGIADRDPIFKRNLAFIGERAIAIDLGAFMVDEGLKKPFLAKRSLFFETLKLRRWLSKNIPELLPYFEKRLNEELQI